MEYVLDAKNKKIGRLASEISLILQGKKSAFYNPRLAGGDTVVVKNVDQLDISIKKMEQKTYYRHTGYMGHLKEMSLKSFLKKSPAAVLRQAVRKMLPQNYINAKRLKRLVIE
ncbi:MAG: 50S ribosomal protein L13 [bacterium]|nr:50S ribosomal protein L13 [bacterium]